MITKPSIEMIAPSDDSAEGDSISVENNKLVNKNSVTPTPEFTIVRGAYDALTGTLTLTNAGGTITRIDGLPTAQNIGEGKKGDRGEIGPKGTPGRNAKDGRDGDQGCPGKKGDKGELGATGAKGEKGNIGETGERGEQGETGERGIKGDAGAEPILTPGNPAFELVKSSNRIMAWGKVETLEDKADIIFPAGSEFSSNETVTILCFFSDPTSIQAQQYIIEDLTAERCLLGLPEDQNGITQVTPWEFSWVALGY